MRKLSLAIFSLILMTALLGACTRQEYGTAGGAVVGGVIGNAVSGGSTAGTVIGAGAGALVGNQVYK